MQCCAKGRTFKGLCFDLCFYDDCFAYFYESSMVCGYSFHCLTLGLCSHFNPKPVKEEAETRTERLPSGE